MKKLLLVAALAIAAALGLTAPASSAGSVCIEGYVNGEALPINGCTALP
ncbi:MAG TPA: hypothetical protein VF230_12570 [Acidimicrobiales bacterium]